MMWPRPQMCNLTDNESWPDVQILSGLYISITMCDNRAIVQISLPEMKAFGIFLSNFSTIIKHLKLHLKDTPKYFCVYLYPLCVKYTGFLHKGKPCFN